MASTPLGEALTVGWGFPCGALVESPWLRHICGVFDRTRHHTTMPIIANQSGTLDLARSYLISTARENKTFDWLIQVETQKWVADVPDPGNRDKPWANLDIIVRVLEQDRALGFDAVAAPVISPDGLPNFGLETLEAWQDVSDSGPMEGLWSGCAFFAMSRACYVGLKILDYAKSTVVREEKPEDKGQPMFCKMDLPRMGEDVSLCANIRDSGFRLAIDSRIPVGPAKAFPQFISREAWSVWRKTARYALKERAERLKA